VITREAAVAHAQRLARAALGPFQGSVVDEFLAARRQEAERDLSVEFIR